MKDEMTRAAGAAAEEPISEKLMHIYDRLFRAFGPQHWWPAETPFEVIVGAILTQAVSWKNVVAAISNLKDAGLLDPRALAAASEETLKALVRPAGYYNAKAKKLRCFARYLVDRWGGDLEAMFSTPVRRLREELLGLHGIGPETADSILLYAGGLPVFVVDAYTIRAFGRLGLLRSGASYEEAQGMFMRHLPEDSALFNEYHALIVELGKSCCAKRSPRCGACPLGDLCPGGVTDPLRTSPG